MQEFGPKLSVRSLTELQKQDIVKQFIGKFVCTKDIKQIRCKLEEFTAYNYSVDCEADLYTQDWFVERSVEILYKNEYYPRVETASSDVKPMQLRNK